MCVLCRTSDPSPKDKVTTDKATTTPPLELRQLATLAAVLEVLCERAGGELTVVFEDEHKPIVDSTRGLAVWQGIENGKHVFRCKLVPCEGVVPSDPG